MSKKLLAVIALVVACLFVFTACGGDNYAFDALENNPAASAQVQSNGGSYVQKGEYSYFINGAEDGTDKNTFGEYHKGSIVRVKTSDLFKKDRKVETVVPKIIYAEEANSSGLYIYGDKIFYTTPNSGKDTQGNVELTKLDFMMANIDGTGTKVITTVEDNAQAFRFVQKDSKVYLLYVGTADITLNDEKTSTTAIYQVECESKQEKLVADNVETVVFDKYSNSASVAYSQKVVVEGLNNKQSISSQFNNLYKYTAGAESAVEIAKGGDAENYQYTKFTPVSLTNEVVYFNSTSQGLQSGNAFSKYDGSITKLDVQNHTNFVVVSGSQDAIITQSNGYIVKVVFGQQVAKSKICAESADIEFEYVSNDHVYYSLTEGYTLHRASITADELVLSEQVIIGQMQSTLWASFDFAVVDGKLCAFYFNDGSDITYINYLYASIIEEGEELEYETKRVGLISKNEQDRVIDNEKDDRYAVEDFLAQEA